MPRTFWGRTRSTYILRHGVAGNGRAPTGDHSRQAGGYRGVGAEGLVEASEHVSQVGDRAQGDLLIRLERRANLLDHSRQGLGVF